MLIRAAVFARSSVGRRIQRLGPQDGVRWTALGRRADVRAFLAAEPCDVVIAEASHHAPGELLAAVRENKARAELVLLAAAGEPIADQPALLAAGCLAVVDLGLDDAALQAILASLFARCLETQVNRHAARRALGRFSLEDFATKSPVMRKFVAVVRRVVQVDSPLLILGETGVGKEHLARAIHAEGPRRDGPFVPVNCGALPESLFESELFGHEQGAFTGAARARRGAFELAHRGSLFLDEIGELPLHLQVKLLRALQDGRIQPVGGEQEIGVDVRVIAATNRDLRTEVEGKRFRSDLFFRLDVVSLTVPPLRARREDVPCLVETHVAEFCRRFARPTLAVREDAMAALQGYPWPGNVRELVNVLERAVLLCEGDHIELTDLPDAVRLGSPAAPGLPHADLFRMPLREAAAQVVDAFEREYLERLLRETGSHLGETARRAGVSPRGLYGMMRRLGLGHAVPAADPHD